MKRQLEILGLATAAALGGFALTATVGGREVTIPGEPGAARPPAVSESETPVTGANGLTTYPPSAPDEPGVIVDGRQHPDAATAPECASLREAQGPYVRVPAELGWCMG